MSKAKRLKAVPEAVRHEFLFMGNPKSLREQADFLMERGFALTYTGAYPALKNEFDYKKALTAIWESGVDGWWNYRAKMVDYKICSVTSWAKKLNEYTAKIAQKHSK